MGIRFPKGTRVLLEEGEKRLNRQSEVSATVLIYIPHLGIFLYFEIVNSLKAKTVYLVFRWPWIGWIPCESL